ncbi:MAG: apolipoprotein N-acyltransferase [Rubrivivax sp.]
MPAGAPGADPEAMPRVGRALPLTLLALALAGAAQTLAFVEPRAWPLPVLGAAFLFVMLRQSAPRRAALQGLAYGAGWLLAAVWWLFVSMHFYGGLPAPLAALALLALCLALSLYLAAASAAFAAWRRGRPLQDALLFAALWLLAELARGVWFTGFPWAASGYAWVDAPWAWAAPLVGVYGMGWGVALAGAALGLAVTARRRVLQVGGALAVAVALALPAAWPTLEFTRPTGTLRVELLQSNVAQDDKFAVEKMPQALAWAASTLAASRADLVLGPETVIPLLPSQLEQFAPDLWPSLQQRFAQPGQAALFGVPLGDFEAGYTNSVVGFHAGTVYRYDKVHLVPFGEFIPPGFRWFTELMRIPLGDFTRGRLGAPPFEFAGERIAPNICYEDLFGEELAVQFADPSRAPTVLANVSNIAWFGNTVALPQHLAISRLRTLELQRPMLRATNTGVTAVIDHRGHVQARLPVLTRDVLQGTVQGREGLTPYARAAAAFGLWPWWGGALVGVALGLAGRRRAAAPTPP